MQSVIATACVSRNAFGSGDDSSEKLTRNQLGGLNKACNVFRDSAFHMHSSAVQNRAVSTVKFWKEKV